MTRHRAQLARLTVKEPPKPNPITPAEIMAALEWQVENPTHPFALESAEAVADYLRRKAEKAGRSNAVQPQA